MKTKLLLFLLLFFSVSQVALASYSEPNSPYAILLTKKSNQQKMKRIEVGEKIYIIKNNGSHYDGKVENISYNTLTISGEEHLISDVKIFGASRNPDGFVATVISTATFTFFASITTIGGVGLLYAMNTGNVSPLAEILFIMMFQFSLFFTIFAGEFFAISGLFYLYNIYNKKRYNTNRWNVDIVRGKKRPTAWQRLKNMFSF